MNKPIRLAVVVNRFPTLSETFIFNKVAGLSQKGMNVTVWAGARGSDQAAFAHRAAEMRQVKVRHGLVSMGKIGLVWSLARYTAARPAASFRLLRAAKELYPSWRRAARAWLLALPLALEGYDVIHFELSGIAASYLDALPLLPPAKLVTSCRGAAEQITPISQPQRAQVLRQTFQHMDAVHCVSRDIQQTAERYGLSPEQAFTNYPSIDPGQFRRSQPYPQKAAGPYRILSVGRLHWKKGLEFGVLAIHNLMQAGYDLEYRIVGSGPEKEKLKFLIHELGLEDIVTLEGSQPASAVKGMLEEADIFLLPSLSEGISNAALEAMAMEVPVVSTTAGGMPEAITDGEDGLLAEPMNADALAAQLEILLRDPALRISMGQAGRRKVIRQFHLQRQIDQFQAVYTSLRAGDNLHASAGAMEANAGQH